VAPKSSGCSCSDRFEPDESKIANESALYGVRLVRNHGPLKRRFSARSEDFDGGQTKIYGKTGMRGAFRKRRKPRFMRGL
jgi:hypothetical protein